MTIEDDIVAWATTKPAWHREVLDALVAGADLGDAAAAGVADRLVGGTHITPAGPWRRGCPGYTHSRSSHGDGAGHLGPTGVKAYAEGQQLTLSPASLTSCTATTAAGRRATPARRPTTRPAARQPVPALRAQSRRGAEHSGALHRLAARQHHRPERPGCLRQRPRSRSDPQSSEPTPPTWPDGVRSVPAAHPPGSSPSGEGAVRRAGTRDGVFVRRRPAVVCPQRRGGPGGTGVPTRPAAAGSIQARPFTGAAQACRAQA